MRVRSVDVVGLQVSFEDGSAGTAQFEPFYVEPEAFLDADIALSRDGVVAVAAKPGIGFEPR